MLIYTSKSNSPFGAAMGYKSASKRKRGGIRRKASKRDTQRHRPAYKAKKVKKSRKTHRKKKLSAKNVKFMKSLGFRAKKH